MTDRMVYDRTNPFLEIEPAYLSAEFMKIFAPGADVDYRHG